MKQILLCLWIITGWGCETTDSKTLEADILACPAAPSDENCQLYRCVEADQTCGAQGYLLGYAEPACQKLKGMCEETLVTEAEQKWIAHVLPCLQNSAQEAAFLSESCSDLTEKAFAGYPHCFVADESTGPSLCALGPDAWQRIANCLDDESTFGKKGRAQLGHALATCSTTLTSPNAQEQANTYLPDEAILKEWAAKAKSLSSAWQNP